MIVKKGVEMESGPLSCIHFLREHEMSFGKYNAYYSYRDKEVRGRVVRSVNFKIKSNTNNIHIKIKNKGN